MRTQQRGWLWSWMFSLAGLPLLATPLAAAGLLQLDPNHHEAIDLEKSEQWHKAAIIYANLLRNDPQRPELKDRYLICLRRAAQVRRHLDPTFRDAAQGCKLSEALDAYEEVLVKVQGSYLYREKIELPVLFRSGIQELRFALESKVFRRAYLPRARPTRLRTLGQRLDHWPDIPATVDEARQQARLVAEAVSHEVGLHPCLAVFELLCGACSGLDEYAAWLTPAELRLEQASISVQGTGTVEDVQLLEDTIGYVRVSFFKETTVQEVRDAVVQLQARQMKVLILDLRGNLGGPFESAVHTSRLFLSEGIIAFTQSRLSDWNKTHRSRNPDALNIPLIVLVDSDTASAAEVVAGALKENGRATIIGQTTFGKGSIQCIMPLERIPAGIRLTVASIFSPSNHPYTGHGVTPSMGMEIAERDAQLQAAIRAARQLVVVMD